MRRVQRRREYYAISAMLPEISTTRSVLTEDLPREYSSKTAVGDLESTRALLAAHGLLDPMAWQDISKDELLR
jgi:hypothetical protein